MNDRCVVQQRQSRWVWFCVLPLVSAMTGCALGPVRVPTEVRPSNVNADAIVTPATRITRDLVQLPPPKFKVPVAVYAFRDQTGQYKPQPDSNLSNAVTQGAASILVKALLDSGWYMPIEREGFQNLLTERRVARAIETPTDKGKAGSSYPQLMPASFIVEGGIVGYESNVRTGGEGASLLGIGGETKYRIDQVTVNLRSVDVRTGQVVNSVSITKTIFSHEISASIYKFVSYKTLLQAEGGYSSNEPSQLAVKEAIESAVIHLTLQGVRDRAWSLKDDNDWSLPMVQGYLRAAENTIRDLDGKGLGDDAVVSMRAPSMILSAPLPTAVISLIPQAAPRAVAVAAPQAPTAQTSAPALSPSLPAPQPTQAAALTLAPAPAAAAPSPKVAPAVAMAPAPTPVPAAEAVAPVTVADSAPAPSTTPTPASASSVPVETTPAAMSVSAPAPAVVLAPAPAPAAADTPPSAPVLVAPLMVEQHKPSQVTLPPPSDMVSVIPEAPQLAPHASTLPEPTEEVLVLVQASR
jgi:curli production assembly/transport component CsgG